MHEYTFTNEFVKTLITLGYPIESIAIEYKVSQSAAQGIIDIAIVDRVTNELLSIFELKVLRGGSSDNQLKQQGQIQLLKYINGIGNPQIPAYLVIAKSIIDYEILPFEVDESGKRVLSPPIPLESLIPYAVLSNSSRTSAIGTKEQEIKKTTDWFKVVCWICAVIVAALAICDNIGLVTISATQLALIGVAIALVLIPFSRKLKILGIEFERLIAEKNDKKPD